MLEDGHCLWDQALAVYGLVTADGAGQGGFAATSLHPLVQMVASELGVTLLPRLAVAAGITAGTAVELRPLSGPGVWCTLGVAWRPDAPCAEEYRTLVPPVTEACRGPAAGAPQVPLR